MSDAEFAAELEQVNAERQRHRDEQAARAAAYVYMTGYLDGPGTVDRPAALVAMVRYHDEFLAGLR